MEGLCLWRWTGAGFRGRQIAGCTDLEVQSGVRLAGSGRQSPEGLPKGQAISQAASPSGSFSRFVNVISARTAVGHDRKGQLVLLHVDGQTEQRG